MGFFNDSDTKATGVFREKSHGHWFEYRFTNDEWALNQGLPHEIAVANGEKRYANVKKTIAYIAIDEGEDCKAIIKKWAITHHTVYDL